ncbi:4Fe-4S binding protein [Sulfuriroseicoccus oceanibius]|uniref:4Fe-4S binding protein n=1 Tax=Sulfuriroseicoccus oceanibius TaxID=2707525 RepID=A0A6B3L590_9BACT|nr:4Fe-4S binding protein [Sulfuriroseicoccus oceanibius]QQL44858.1 4Fe-4S binding protein [Sulfuriroseicoccus oceanibius]
MSQPISRRHWLSSLLRPTRPTPSGAGSPAVVAEVIEARCLAYHHSPCSTCYERCPQPGAIHVTQGMPTIDPEACTGCEICIDLCPAPIKAIHRVPRSVPS